MFRVIVLHSCTPEALHGVNNLLPQLGLASVKPRSLLPARLKAILAQTNLKFIAAVASDGRVVGMLILYFVRIPSGLTAWLEDFVVDEKLRKWGVGRLLVEKAVGLAKKERARHLSLRTNPKRLEANKLYQQLGFFRMRTNFYRMNLFR